jgi:hypothetical protein
MLNVITLSVIRLNVLMPGVVRMSVVAPSRVSFGSILMLGWFNVNIKTRVKEENSILLMLG